MRGLRAARGLRSARGALFVVPYLPFLVVFGILPMIYALYLAVTNDEGGWVRGPDPTGLGDG